jgi:hypothetical protein
MFEIVGVSVNIKCDFQTVSSGLGHSRHCTADADSVVTLRKNAGGICVVIVGVVVPVEIVHCKVTSLYFIFY